MNLRTLTLAATVALAGCQSTPPEANDPKPASHVRIPATTNIYLGAHARCGHKYSDPLPNRGIYGICGKHSCAIPLSLPETSEELEKQVNSLSGEFSTYPKNDTIHIYAIDKSKLRHLGYAHPQDVLDLLQN